MTQECNCGCIESHKKKMGLQEEKKIINIKKNMKPNQKEIFSNYKKDSKKKKK